MTNNNIILNEPYYFQNINLSCTSSFISTFNFSFDNKIEICNRNFKYLLFGIDLSLSNISYQTIATLSSFDEKITNLTRYTFAQEESSQSISSKDYLIIRINIIPS